MPLPEAPMRCMCRLRWSALTVTGTVFPACWFRPSRSACPNASDGAALVVRSSRFNLADRAEADGKWTRETSSSRFRSRPLRQLRRVTTSSRCRSSSYPSFVSGMSSLLAASANWRSDFPKPSAMRHARALFGLCAATRMTAAKSGDDIFSVASFTNPGSSAKNESPASSVTARRMLSGHACRTGAKSTWKSAVSSGCSSAIAPITPAKGSGSNRSKHLSGRMNSFESPNSTTAVAFRPLSSQTASR